MEVMVRNKLCYKPHKAESRHTFPAVVLGNVADHQGDELPKTTRACQFLLWMSKGALWFQQLALNTIFLLKTDLITVL